MIYDPRRHYWLIGDEETQVYASAASGYVPLADADFIAWTDAGNVPTKIATFDELVAVLRAANVPPYHLVPTRLIVDRLQQAGLLAAARAALDGADLYLRERWNSRTDIYADDADARALLAAIGADPDAILAAN